jgi:hypothetical protein
MKQNLLPVVIGASVALGALLFSGYSEEKSHKLTTISPRKMADSLHAVIAADRQVYAALIVQRLDSDERRVPVTENWREGHGLPVPAQMLRRAGQSIQKGGAEFSYALRSLWPINENSGPQTEVEQTGLEYIARHPGENYYAEELLGGRGYFTAIYPDQATLSCCVECHNRHPRSPRRDFKLNEVMGAVVVRVPLEF